MLKNSQLISKKITLLSSSLKEEYFFCRETNSTLSRVFGLKDFSILFDKTFRNSNFDFARLSSFSLLELVGSPCMYHLAMCNQGKLTWLAPFRQAFQLPKFSFWLRHWKLRPLCCLCRRPWQRSMEYCELLLGEDDLSLNWRNLNRNLSVYDLFCNVDRGHGRVCFCCVHFDCCNV